MENQKLDSAGLRERLLTVEQLRIFLWTDQSAPCVRSLRAWTKSRLIPSIKLGQRVFYRLRDVEAALASRTRGGVR